MFIAKYDVAGTLLWVRQAGGTNDDGGSSVAADPAGNCYVTGAFSGVASFGPTNLVGSTAPASSDIFVAKYDSLGNLLWARQAGGDRGNVGRGIVADTNGNSYVTGVYTGTATFGNVTLPSTGSFPNGNVFLAKYDTDGNVLWARYVAAYQDDGGEAVALDPQGNVCMTGFIGGISNVPSMYLAKYSSAGDLLWLSGAANGQSAGYGVAADVGGNVFVTGDLWGTVSFGAVRLTSKGKEDAFVAKFDANGDVLWVEQMGSTNSYASGLRTATDTWGSCYVGGEFTGGLTTSFTNFTSRGAFQDAFVAKFGPGGNLIWILQVGGTGLDIAGGVAWSPAKGLYVTGGFSDGTIFGGIPVDAYGPGDVFLARIEELPILSVTSTPSEVLVSWSTNVPGFTLERATNSLPASGWSTVTNRVSVSGDHCVVTEQLSGSSSFYRLTKP
jgi:hypothetical protein